MRSWWARLRRWFSRKKSPSGAPAPDSGPPVQEDPGLPAETLQRAVERLLEDEALTADLVDDAAEYLLAWGKDQVRAILTEEAGATENHPRLLALRRQMRALARQVGELPPEEQARALRTLLVGK